MKYLFMIVAVLLIGCTAEVNTQPQMVEQVDQQSLQEEEQREERAQEPSLALATFAGGCFWCTESDFEKVEGVIDVVSGYTGGFTENPTYKETSAGGTGHTEAVQVTYDPSVVSYEELLDWHWRHHDPTDNEGQFVDRGKQYRPGIFYHNEEQRVAAEKSKETLEASNVFEKPIVAEITQFDVFYPAEDYHQDFYKKNPVRYKYYRSGSGRDQFLESVWGTDQ